METKKELKKVLRITEEHIEYLKQQMQSEEVTMDIERELYLQRIKNMETARDEISRMITQEHLKK
jgi:bacterioferritin (cytochrome b1)